MWCQLIICDEYQRIWKCELDPWLVIWKNYETYKRGEGLKACSRASKKAYQAGNLNFWTKAVCENFFAYLGLLSKYLYINTSIIRSAHRTGIVCRPWYLQSIQMQNIHSEDPVDTNNDSLQTKTVWLPYNGEWWVETVCQIANRPGTWFPSWPFLAALACSRFLSLGFFSATSNQ